MTIRDINEKIREKTINISLKTRLRIFSAAYILGGPKFNFGKYLKNIEGIPENDMVIRMIKFVYYNQDKIVNGVKSSGNQFEVFEHLKSFSGLGIF